MLGKQIHCQTWGEDKPGLLFVHGHAAHAHWWDFIAPNFRQQYRVGAMDMSGNGDSEHREKYSASQFATEIAEVASWLSDETIIVAHSFGGSMARIAAHKFPDQFKALVLVDSVISPHRRETKTPEPIAPPRERIYDTLEVAAKRFRLRPPQPRPADYVHQYIAEHSIGASGNGFQFKLDPQVFEKMWPEPEPLPDGVSMVKDLKIPCAYIYGELSRFCPPEALELLKQIFPEDHLLGVAEAHHHVFLDQPEAFTQSLEKVLEVLSR